jgi:8-oxo-dGTP diphosphatase
VAPNQPDTQRDYVAAVIASIAACDAVEAAHLADAAAWLGSGAELYRRVKPAIPPKHLVVYAAIFDPARQQIFLIRHRESGLWLPTGGHVDPGETPLAAARRELIEETGASLLALTEHPLFLTVQETVGDPAQRHTDVSLWYGFAACVGECFEIAEDEADGGDWFDRASLEALACEPNTPRFMRKLSGMRFGPTG